MADNLWLGLLGSGLAANRPTTPTAETGNFVFWYSTDTAVLSLWNGSAWVVQGQTGSVQTPITAATTQTLVAATQLTGTYANVSTVANSGDSVKLPLAPTVGQQIMVTNSGASPAWVYPGESGTAIDGGTAGAKVTLTNAKSALFTCISAGNWQSIGMATRSA